MDDPAAKVSTWVISPTTSKYISWPCASSFAAV
jgi:hypothetical protein